ncbi:dimethylargininase [Patulibacter sp. SYSU D01012]|uniref:dimethylargininase n=1 Tax=Patulibacter sp. SYSU D01012 TaxID=2817381 RepID=UPI001B311052|nr:dimethylargininase [Patulibacter sp. SYSU D01012]
MPTAPRALVRRPSPRLAEGLLTHLDRQPVDVDLALRQWDGYVAAIADAGWEIVEVQAAPEHPDSHFIEDTVAVFGDLAVITRPATDARRGEEEATAETLQRLGYRIARIEAPGTLEGGDVLKLGERVYVGRSTRSNAAGIGQLRRILAGEGRRLTAVPIPGALHLKSAVTALPDGTFVGWPDALESAAFWPGFRAVPEFLGAQVVTLGPNRVLLSASAPKTAELYADLGYDVVTVDVTEYEKLEGCVTCLSVRLREAPRA